jgi:hypothetical protein
MAASPPVVDALDTREVVPAVTPLAPVAESASERGVAAVPDRLAAVPNEGTAAAPLTQSTPSLHATRSPSASDAFAAPTTMPVGSRDHLAAPPVDRAQASERRATASAPGAVPAGSIGVGSAAAAAAGSAASGPALWLWLTALASFAVFFCRVTLIPALPRPVPFISLLERPG